MREVSCSNCNKAYMIDDSKIKQNTVKVICKQCGQTFLVEKQSEPEVRIIDMPRMISKGHVEPETNESISKVDASADTTASKSIRWMNRIQVRITATLVFLTTAILVGYAVVNYHLEKADMDRKLSTQADITVTRLSRNLVEPFWALDDDLLRESLVSEMMDKQIYAILVRDRDGKDIYIGKKRNSKWKIVNARTDVSRTSLITRKMKILKGKDQIGSVEVYLTTKFMTEELKRSTIYMIVAVLILDLILFLSIYFILSRSIIRPIMNLTNAADQISTGQMNAELTIRTNDEIGMLIKAFQRMQTSLNLALRRLST
ncbi:MAG: HAMP domain-containing protein [Desulfobacteraceae bacterium]|nr:MAG: HAMP domain-containing protein [Desulfobacteraceae bacterium]